MATEMNVEAERAALLPCPFCGDAMKLETIDDVVTGPGQVFVQCDCGATSAGGGDLDEAIAAWNRRAAQPADVGATLPPIEFDRSMERTYIPLPSGWEIQTRGNGSTFRIAHAPSRQRWAVLDDRLHEPLEAMARDMRNAVAAPPLSSEQQDPPINQCDGCRQGAPMTSLGNHIDSNGKPFMYCQKQRYESFGEQQAGEGEGACGS